METVHIITIDELSVTCPYCGSAQGDWMGIPRGETVTCEDCGKDFYVAKDAELEMEL